MKLLYVMLVLGLLVGCSTQPKEVVITDTIVITRDIPEQLLEYCVPEEFVVSESYLELTFPERENYLTDYIVGLYYVISKCNSQLKSIRDSQENSDEGE